MSLQLDEHRLYIGDAVRIDAFRRAIGEVVRSGDVVVDLGAGTGVLGFLACRAGARAVYAIEAGGIVELAREVCRANGLGDRVTFINEISTRAAVPEPADVIVTDQIGRFGVEAGLFEYLVDARRRFLRAGGRIIPAALSFLVAPVECPAAFDRVDFWRHRQAGVDFSAAHAVALNTGYPVDLRAPELLGVPRVGASIDLATATAGCFTIEATLEIERGGCLHGIGAWFAARLSPNVTMTNGPDAEGRINRSQVFLPLARSVPAAAGDVVHVSMRVLPVEPVVTWAVEISRPHAGPPVRFRHSTVAGMLVSREELARTRPDWRPALSPWGAARRSVLRLMDGRRSLGEIEAEIARQHADLFSSGAQLSAFVARVMASDAR